MNEKTIKGNRDSLKVNSNLLTPSNSGCTLSFEELQRQYISSDSEEEKKYILRDMSRRAQGFDNWLFVFSNAKEQNIHYKAEKQLVKAASTIPNLVFIVNNFNLTWKRKKHAIKKALRLALNERDLKSLKEICRKNFMMSDYKSTKVRIALVKAML